MNSKEFIIESFKPIMTVYGYKGEHDYINYMLICEYLSDSNDGYLYKITKRPQNEEEHIYYDEEYNTIIVKLSQRPDYADVEYIWRHLMDNN